MDYAVKLKFCIYIHKPSMGKCFNIVTPELFYARQKKRWDVKIKQLCSSSIHKHNCKVLSR